MIILPLFDDAQKWDAFNVLRKYVGETLSYSFAFGEFGSGVELVRMKLGLSKVVVHRRLNDIKIIITNNKNV